MRTEERTLLLDKVDALRRRLERVTSERDRAVEAATYFQCYRARRKSDRSAAIAGAIRWIAPETIVDAGAAAAQADRPVEPVTVRMPTEPLRVVVVDFHMPFSAVLDFEPADPTA